MGKKHHWQIFDTGRSSAAQNMAFDSHLLDRAESYERPVLHLYEWEAPSATYGHFIDPSQFLDLAEVERLGLQLARRPTGGGIIFHIWDMAFSVLVPAHCPEYSTHTLDNYAFVNQAVLDAVRDCLHDPSQLSLIKEDAAALDAACGHFCMAKPTKYDVLLQGKKVAGSAQRKTRRGFLHQGSISLQLPSQELLEKVLLPGTKVADAMYKIAYPLLDASVPEGKERLKVLLATHLNNASLKYAF
jgi:lipoate-protein ligase A